MTNQPPHSPSAPLPAPVRRYRADRLVVLGYISAVSMPPIGFVLALALAFRNTRKHAFLIAVVAVLACAMWAAIISSGALTATDNSF